MITDIQKHTHACTQARTHTHAHTHTHNDYGNPLAHACQGLKQKKDICYISATALSQVQLLVSAEDIQNYTRIRKSLERLKLLVEEAELWVQSKPGVSAAMKAPKVQHCMVPHMLCCEYCVVLYCTVLYCAVSAVLYCTVLSCAVLCCPVLYCAVSAVLYCTVLSCAVLCCECCAVLYCTVLYSMCCAVLYCIVLCCTVL